VRRRRLAGAVLLGACLLLGSGRMFGQRGDTPAASGHREVIATSVPVTPAPAADAPGSPRVAPPAPLPSPIKQASFVEEVPNNAALTQSPAPAASTATPAMLSPTALLGSMTSSPAPVKAVNLPEGPAAALSVEVVGPDRVLLGKTLVHEIVIRNRGARPVAEVHVEEPLPEGVRVLESDPPAVMHENRLTWDLRHLEAGGERRLKIELNPGRADQLDLRPYVTFLNGSGLRTRVIRPPFSIEMSANRAKAARGERIRFSLQLANNGDVPIRNIKIYDTLPAGLHHPNQSRNRMLGIEHFGDLQPGQRCTITLETTAVESGSFRNSVLAQADSGVEAKAALDVVITEPNLTLRMDGPVKTLTRRGVDFHLEVANPGSLPAKAVRLMLALPPTFEVVSASTGAALYLNQHAVAWSLPDLGAGQRQTFMLRIKANSAGDWPMTAAVVSQNFPEARASKTLHAEAEAVLNLEAHVKEENLSVGEETNLRMHVFNNGDAPCVGLLLTATLPDSVTAMKAEGPSGEQIEKQQVRFLPLPQLEAHRDAIYRIRLRGLKPGKGSLRVELTAEKQTPAVRELSIQVNDAKLATTEKNANSIPGDTLR